MPEAANANADASCLLQPSAAGVSAPSGPASTPAGSRAVEAGATQSVAARAAAPCALWCAIGNTARTRCRGVEVSKSEEGGPSSVST